MKYSNSSGRCNLILFSEIVETKGKIKSIREETLLNRIYIIRGQKVMLDRNLAALYQVETKRLNEQVRRNPGRFPVDFMFQLTEKEFENLKSHFATSSWGGNRKLPFVFTEQGVAMLSSVLNSERAIHVNIQIMRLFTKIRQSMIDNTELRLAIEEVRKRTDNNTKNIELVFKYFDEMLERNEKQKERVRIGYKP